MYGTMSGAKIVDCSRGAIAPNRVGPSRIPASTSPITRGWPSFGIRLPHRRANSITTTTAMKNATTVFSAVRCLVAERCSGRAAAALTPLTATLPAGVLMAAPTAVASAVGGGVSIRSSARPAAVPATVRSPPCSQVTAPASVPAL